MVEDSAAALLAGGGPVDRLLQQSTHGRDAVRGDAQPLLDEPRLLQRVRPTEAAEDGRRADADAGEPDRRVPVRERVRERRVVDGLHPGRSASTMNSVGP